VRRHHFVDMKRFLFLTLTFVLFIWSSPAVAQWVPVAQKEGFGKVVGADANSIVVGDPENTYTPGRVVAYGRTDGSWVETASLEASDGTLDDRFGAALDVNEGRLVVGAPGKNAAYVFRRTSDAGSWTEVGKVGPPAHASEFGTSVSLTGDRLFVSAAVAQSGGEDGTDSALNSVYVFERTGEGGWREEAVLRNESIAGAGRFGATLAARDEHLVVGAPDHQGGAAAVYRHDESGWRIAHTLSPEALAQNAGFGTSMEWAEDRLVVGAPRDSDGTGAVYVMDIGEKEWTVESRLLPFRGVGSLSFGAGVAFGTDGLWIGAPHADRETGALFHFRFQEDSWAGVHRVTAPSSGGWTRVGATVALSGETVAVGLPRARHGGGALGLYSSAEGMWTDGSPVVPSERPAFRSVTGEEIRCADGTVQEFACRNVTLKAFLPLSEVGAEGGVELSDIWGWTDPKTGTEYALVGRADGTAFVDVSTPTNPVYVGELPKTEGSRVNSWRDIKVYDDHAFIVADNVGAHGMQVFDLTEVRSMDRTEGPVTFEATALYDRIHSAHNLAINVETGYAYIVGGSGGGESCGGALHMVNIQNPQNPTFEGCYEGHSETGAGGTGGTHDAQCVVYEGPDQEYKGREICIGFDETVISVVDVTEKDAPETIAVTSYPDHGYVHQGWFTENQRYMYSNDELDELQGKVDRTRTIVWDMSDLDNPTVTNQVFLSEASSDHNLYIEGDRMYQSNYKSGLRVLDITNPEQPEEVGHFDLFPPENTPGFEGTWSNYPYFDSGIIVTSTYEGGLFVLEYSEPEL